MVAEGHPEEVEDEGRIEHTAGQYHRHGVEMERLEAAGGVQWVVHHRIGEAEVVVELEDTEIASTMIGMCIGPVVDRLTARRRDKVEEVVEGGEEVRVIPVGAGASRARHQGGIGSQVHRAEVLEGGEVRVIRVIVGGVAVGVGTDVVEGDDVRKVKWRERREIDAGVDRRGSSDFTGKFIHHNQQTHSTAQQAGRQGKRHR